jgi:ankyrin repeat protein
VLTWLPFDAPLSAYQQLGEPLHDVARRYDFLDASALIHYVAQASEPASPVHQFEAAVESVINGDIESLARQLQSHPSLTVVRSSRITHFDPPVHGATLLHYLAANGVEGYRQKSPANAVSVACLLLQNGADPNALAYWYGAPCTTMSLLVSSTPPAHAGTQIGLIDTLIDHGATVDEEPLLTALSFSFQPAAEALVRRGVKVENVAAAAGLGLVDETAQLLPAADAPSLHLALALAAQLGHAATTELLLRAGVDPNRFNPSGTHAHSTPLHQAALAGHEAVVRLLVKHGARPDIEDTIFHATPLGWAEHGGQPAIAKFLRSHTNPELIS